MMNEFILIMAILMGDISGNNIVGGFKTKASCEAAGNDIAVVLYEMNNRLEPIVLSKKIDFKCIEVSKG